MSNKKNEVPAFPLSAMVPDGMALNGQPKVRVIVQGGMSLRDYFAAQCINGILGQTRVKHAPGMNDEQSIRLYFEEMSLRAFQLADNMILARGTDGAAMTSDKG